jgi:hypothetical protein
MRKISIWLILAAALPSLMAAPATASPNCLRGHQPFTLKDDTVNWSMRLTRGPECLQGLRWSYMQIYSVAVVTPPKHGTLVIMGSGFRYVANAASEANGDSFKLAVVGKNRHDHGASTIEIVVGATSDPG